MSLFRSGSFSLHAGQESWYKIDCDVFDEGDYITLAKLIVERVPPFGAVEGVPKGGLPLAGALQLYVSEGPLLIVDDVITTGTSMERHRNGREAIGAVVFARNQVYPSWITSIFVLTNPK